MKLRICCLLLLADLVLVYPQPRNMRSQYRDLFEHYPHLRHFISQPRYSGFYGSHYQRINDGHNYEEERDYYPYEHKKKYSHEPEKEYNHRYKYEHSNKQHQDYNEENPFPEHYKHHFEDWAEKQEPPHEPSHYGYLHHDLHYSKKHHKPRQYEYKHKISHFRPKEPFDPYEHVDKYYSNEPRENEPNRYIPDNQYYKNGDEEGERGYNDNFGFDSSPFDYGKLDFASSSDSFAFDTVINHNQFADKRIHSPKRLAKILGL